MEMKCRVTLFHDTRQATRALRMGPCKPSSIIDMKLGRVIGAPEPLPPLHP